MSSLKLNEPFLDRSEVLGVASERMIRLKLGHCRLPDATTYVNRRSWRPGVELGSVVNMTDDRAPCAYAHGNFTQGRPASGTGRQVRAAMMPECGRAVAILFLPG